MIAMRQHEKIVTSKRKIARLLAFNTRLIVEDEAGIYLG
jgi:hypothetical protein